MTHRCRLCGDDVKDERQALRMRTCTETCESVHTECFFLFQLYLNYITPIPAGCPGCGKKFDRDEVLNAKADKLPMGTPGVMIALMAIQIVWAFTLIFGSAWFSGRFTGLIITAIVTVSVYGFCEKSLVNTLHPEYTRDMFSYDVKEMRKREDVMLCYRKLLRYDYDQRRAFFLTKPISPKMGRTAVMHLWLTLSFFFSLIFVGMMVLIGFEYIQAAEALAGLLIVCYTPGCIVSVIPVFELIYMSLRFLFACVLSCFLCCCTSSTETIFDTETVDLEKVASEN